MNTESNEYAMMCLLIAILLFLLLCMFPGHGVGWFSEVG